MVNRVILIGNLGKDPEVRRLETGTAVAKFSLATSDAYKDQGGNWVDQTEWHNIIAWRNMAERAETTLKKGMTVYIDGKLTHRKWQDAEGKDRWSTEVVANYFRIVNKRDGAGNSGYFPSANDEPGATTAAPVATNTPAPQVNQAPIEDAADDDLPF